MAERWISEAINVVGKQIAALVADDYETFKGLFTPKIRNEEMTPVLFKKARELYKMRPLVIEAVDVEISEVLSEEEVELKMVKTGRTLCHLKKIRDNWRVDDIYWDTSIELPEDVINQLNEEESAESSAESEELEAGELGEISQEEDLEMVKDVSNEDVESRPTEDLETNSESEEDREIEGEEANEDGQTEEEKKNEDTKEAGESA